MGVLEKTKTIEPFLQLIIVSQNKWFNTKKTKEFKYKTYALFLQENPS